MQIIKSLSDALPLCPNSVIQIRSPSKWGINSSGSFSINSNLPLWNLLFNLSREEAVCGAYLLTNLYYATLQFPSMKSSLFALFTSCGYPTHATPDGKMMATTLHLPPAKKNKLLSGKDAQTAWAHTAEYEIDSPTVWDILDQICKDTDLYMYFKQHKSNRDSRGAHHAIHSRWLGPNHVNTTASGA